MDTLRKSSMCGSSDAPCWRTVTRLETALVTKGEAATGDAHASGRYAVLHVGRTAGLSRLGIALTRKMIPHAVERNRVRRLVREAFRRHVAKQLPLDCVVTLRQPISRPDLDAFRVELDALLAQLCPAA